MEFNGIQQRNKTRNAEGLHCVQITLTLSGTTHPQNFCQFKTVKQTEENELLEPLELSDSHVTDREVPAGNLC